MRLPFPSVRQSQPERRNQVDICALYMCDRYTANQVYIIISPNETADVVVFRTVVLSAIQDILLQLHWRECGLL